MANDYRQLGIVDQPKLPALGERYGFGRERATGDQDGARCAMVVENSPELPQLPDADLPGLPMLALNNQDLARPANNQVGSAVGLPAAQLVNVVSKPAEVFADVALELKGVEMAYLIRPVKTPPIQCPLYDSGGGKQQRRAGQEPEKPLTKHREHQGNGSRHKVRK